MSWYPMIIFTGTVLCYRVIKVAVDKTNVTAVRLNQMKLDVLFTIYYTMYHYSVLSSVYISFRRQVDFTIT